MTQSFRFSFRTGGALALVALAAMVSSSIALGAQERSTAAGVFTDAQAKRGEKLYAESCSACHGADLKGTNVIPALVGMEFEGYWRGQKVGELFEKVSVTMPKTAPGSLKPEQAADAVAYLLSMLKAPAGTTELGTTIDDLNAITIAK